MSLAERIVKVIYPEGLVCDSCGREAVLTENGFCPECALGAESFINAPYLEGVDGYTAAYIYNDVSSRMVKRLKYGGARYMARPLARAIVLPADWHIDAVVPVPLHYKRFRERGFNQSELISKHLAEINGLELRTDLLERIRPTQQQTALSVSARKRNVKDAFEADEACKGLDILIVDDVRTTGSTLVACAEALRKAGCGRVYAATVCFAQTEGG